MIEIKVFRVKAVAFLFFRARQGQTRRNRAEIHTMYALSLLLLLFEIKVCRVKALAFLLSGMMRRLEGIGSS